MSAFIAWIMAASVLISGNTSSVSEPFAAAVAKEVIETPLTKDPRFDALVFVEMAWRESHYQEDAQGDPSRIGLLAQCSLQVHVYHKSLDGWSREEVRSDPYKCVHTAMHIMKYSWRICRSHPLAPYASGTCTNKAGISISDFRMWEVRNAYAKMSSRYIELASRE